MKLKLSWNEKKSANVYNTEQCLGHCVPITVHCTVTEDLVQLAIGFLTDSGVMIVCTKEKPLTN